MPAFKEENLPLDLKSDKYHDTVTGTSSVIPLLDSKWIENEEIEFISYVPVPVNVDILKQTCSNVSETDLQAWEDRAKFINTDLNWLLCQSHSRFWNHVIFNKSINMCLDSFLKSSPRSHDLWKFLPDRILNLQKEIHRSIFMVYLRMATHKESKEDFFTPEIFGEILYENFLFDIPKILDLCSLYGGENSKNNNLLSKMLENVFKKQPKYIDDLRETIPSICQTLDKIRDDINPVKVGKERRSELQPAALNDFIIYLHDTTQTLISFLHTLTSLCQYFFNDGFVQRIAGFYEETIPLFDQRYRSLKTERTFLNRVKFNLVKISRFIIDAHCLVALMNGEIESINEIKKNSIEDFLSVMMELLSFKRFLRVYNLQYSIELDIDIIHSSGQPVDETRLQYLISAISELGVPSDKSMKMWPQQLNDKSRKSKSEGQHSWDKIKPATSPVGADVIMHASSSKEAVETSSESMSDVALSSMISHVKDLLPDCGEGFILLCLQNLNYDVEKTINLILEDSLPGELSNLDRNLSKSEAMKKPDVLSSRHNIYDKDEFDVFSNANVDLSRVRKGKTRATESMKTVFDKERDVESTKNLILNYDETFNDYEDEYDDTYDEQNVGAQDADSADELSEITLRRPFTTPRALQHLKEVADDDGDENDDVQDTGETSSKGDEQKECNDGEKQQRGHRHGNQRQQIFGNNDVGKRQVRSGNTERDRSYKDKHKAKIANHNRKTAAAKKYSKGMM
ncbi:activating signal cointegrator 1 complex subunit 2-like [Dendronephthya gigantea]|uniref:activating signal cointegrator 1 complex subunit 2-like n=1 Tax=Dendronephthya gigantea TaxID=151771 RepID=UPI00106A70F4|nr:activating signal cointegrator 1 complex subunit 2-like [Dendronephthya gigantea]